MSDMRRAAGPRGMTLALVTALFGLPGCSLITMAGKMIMGDPVVSCAFSQQTHVDLVKDARTVLVVCKVPESVKKDFPSLGFDILDGVTRRLKRQGVSIISPNEVASWMDDNGGRWDDVGELADEFDTDYIIDIDIQKFTHTEENSPDLFRGRAAGMVTAHEVRSSSGLKSTHHVFEREFNSEYPSHHPISVTTISSKTFRKQYVDRVCSELSHLFYNHRMSEEVY